MPIIWNPCTPPPRLRYDQGIHFSCKCRLVNTPAPGAKVNCELPHPYMSHTHTVYVLPFWAYSITSNALWYRRHEQMNECKVISIVLICAITHNLQSQRDWVWYLLAPVFLLCLIKCCYGKEEFDTDCS